MEAVRSINTNRLLKKKKNINTNRASRPKLVLKPMTISILPYVTMYIIFIYNSIYYTFSSLYVQYSIVLRKYQFGLLSFTISIDLIHKVLAFRCLLTIDIGFFWGKIR